MARYLLSESAQQDILSIRDYTVDTWGETQAATYLDQMEHRLEWLADNPALGKKRHDIKEGYISFPEGRHIIFYRVAGDAIEVMGIIHQSEDTDMHFNNEYKA